MHDTFALTDTMDNLRIFLRIAGEKLDEFVNSIVLFVPFTCNKNCDISSTAMSQSKARPVTTATTVAKPATTATANGESYPKKEVTSKRRWMTAKTGIPEEKDILNEQIMKDYRNQDNRLAHNMDLCYDKNWLEKFGVVAVRVGPEDIKLAKELRNRFKMMLFEENIKNTGRKKKCSQKKYNPTCPQEFQQNSCVQITDISADTRCTDTKSVTENDTQVSFAFYTDLWKSIMAPLDVIVQVLPSCVFGESKHQVSAVYGGNFLDRLIKSLPISPFGGVSESRDVSRSSKDGVRRTWKPTSTVQSVSSPKSKGHVRKFKCSEANQKKSEYNSKKRNKEMQAISLC